MVIEMIISNKEITIYFAHDAGSPLVILNSFCEEDEAVHEELRKMKTADFTLASIKITGWDAGLSRGRYRGYGIGEMEKLRAQRDHNPYAICYGEWLHRKRGTSWKARISEHIDSMIPVEKISIICYRSWRLTDIMSNAAIGAETG